MGFFGRGMFGRIKRGLRIIASDPRSGRDQRVSKGRRNMIPVAGAKVTIDGKPGSSSALIRNEHSDKLPVSASTDSRERDEHGQPVIRRQKTRRKSDQK